MPEIASLTAGKVGGFAVNDATVRTAATVQTAATVRSLAVVNAVLIQRRS